MNFNRDDEKRGGLPPIMGSFKKTSSFGRVPGFSRAAGGIMDRLKSLSKKDMAFVGIGLSVLVMAPVAEYLMSKPSADNLLSPGFGGREKGSASGVYEGGINGLSQGSVDGSGEVITPLSARDPLSLILGAQSAPPPAPVSAPPSNLRDAMKDVGRSAFSEAAKSAGAPTPIPKMQSGLRAMGSFFSGGESSRSADSLNGDKVIQEARNASRKAASRSMVGPVAMAGYKGVASTPNSSSRGAFEKLRSQADKSAGNFSGESAMGSLDRAAASSPDIGSGSGGLGAGGNDEKTRNPSNSNNRNEHSNSGETLEQMAAKQRMQKALDWEFFKKYEIPKQIIQAALDGIVKKGLIDPLADMLSVNMNSMLGNYPPTQFCWQPTVCEDGDCKQAVAENKVKAAVDLCIRFGTVGYKMQAGGKDAATFSIKRCICGEGNSPKYGKPYVPGSGGADTATSTTTAGPVTPQQVSAVAGNFFAAYDGVLQDMVIQTSLAEANASDPAKVEAGVKSVKGGFQNLGARFNDEVMRKLTTARADANTELNVYYGKVAKTQEKLAETQRKYDKLNAQLAVLERDMADPDTKALKVNRRRAAGIGVAASIPVETIEEIKKAIAELRREGPGNIANADALLTAHRNWVESYRKQLRLVDAGISSIREKQTALDRSVGGININDPGRDWLAKLKEITGRPPEAAPRARTAAVPGRVLDSFFAFAGPNALRDSIAPGGYVRGNMDSAFGRGAGRSEAAPPLRQAAAGLRGLDWDTLWAKEHKFDSSKAAADEMKAWKDWRDKVAGGQAEQERAAADNFVSNTMHSNEIQQDIKGQYADLERNIPGTLSLVDSLMADTKQRILRPGISETYFADASPAAGATAPASVPLKDAKDAAKASVGVDLTAAATAREAAERKNSELNLFKPKRPELKEKLDGFKEDGNRALNKIRESEYRMQAALAGIDGCDTQTCIDGKKEIISKERGIIRERTEDLWKAFDAAEKIKKPAGGGGAHNLKPVPVPVAGNVTIVQQFNNGNTVAPAINIGVQQSAPRPLQQTSGNAVYSPPATQPLGVGNYQIALAQKNTAIADMKRSVAQARTHNDDAKSKYDEAFGYCGATCGNGFGSSACFWGCSKLKDIEGLNGRFITANDGYKARLKDLAALKSRCESWYNGIDAKIRKKMVGKCEQ